jgi:hypothetical protein
MSLQQQGFQAEARGVEIVRRVFACARQIADRLIRHGWHRRRPTICGRVGDSDRVLVYIEPHVECASVAHG